MLYSKVEKLAPAAISNVRKMYKGVSANVDFYSGFVYKMLNLPVEPHLCFGCAYCRLERHRVEEIISAEDNRPAYNRCCSRENMLKMKDRCEYMNVIH